jgi:lysozyme
MTAGRKQQNGENNMQISEEGKQLIKKFEGCPTDGDMAVSYRCAANVPTIGYGSTRYKGKPVKDGMKITLEEADKLLAEELHEYELHITNMVNVNLSENQFAALVAWCFNIGPSAAKGSSAIRLLNEHKYDEVPKSMKLWNKATVNGEKVVLEGLVRRREAEALLFEGKEWHEV